MNQVESAHATSVASGFQTLMMIITLAALVIGVIVAALIIRSLDIVGRNDFFHGKTHLDG